MKNHFSIKKILSVILILSMLMTCVGTGFSDEVRAYAEEAETATVSFGTYVADIVAQTDLSDASKAYQESGNAEVTSELLENGSRKITFLDEMNIRVRTVFGDGSGVAVDAPDKILVKYTGENGFDISKLAGVQGNPDAADGWDSIDLGAATYGDGYALFEAGSGITSAGVIYALRFKGKNMPDASFVIEGVYVITNDRAASTEETSEEGHGQSIIGTEFTVGNYTGKISGTATIDINNVVKESAGLALATDQPADGVKFVMDETGKARNRIYLNDKNGVDVKEGDLVVIEYTTEGGFEFANLTVEGQITGADAYDNDTLFGSFNNVDGYAVLKVNTTCFDKTVYALRLKAESGQISQGAAITIKNVYVLTDVVNNAAVSYNYEISKDVMGITVTYYNDAHSRGIAWRTKNVEAAASVLQYVERSKVDNIAEFDWSGSDVITVPDNYGSMLLENSNVAADKYYCHKAHIENLPEDSSYFYRVGCEESGWSKPGVITVDADAMDLNFIHVTDPQATSESEYQQYANVLAEAYKMAESLDGSTLMGTFNTGDVTNENHDNKIWIDQFNMSQDLDADDLMNSVFIPVAGNHDVSPDIFFSMYDIDAANYCFCGNHDTHRTGICYSLKVGNVFILATNSNESGDLSNGVANGEYDSKANYHEQYSWIVEQLESASEMRANGEIDFIIYLTHAGMMSVGYHTMDGGSVQLRKNITPLLAKYSVDLVLQGHDHAYTRTVPYYYGIDLNGDYFSGYESNNRETAAGYGDVTYDNPYTEEIETFGDRIWNIEPEGTHYITINYAGVKSLDISQDNASSSYKVPDKCILDGVATSPVNAVECGLKYAKQFYGIIRVSGDTLTYDTYAFDGGQSKLYDTFTVIKDGYHMPSLDKQEITFEGIDIRDKQYDGKAARLDISEINAVDPVTGLDVSEFTEYDRNVYYVTGTLKNGQTYTQTGKLPKEEGHYTLHVEVGSECSFFRGGVTIDFSITESAGASESTKKDYIGGLTAGRLNSDAVEITISADTGDTSDSSDSPVFFVPVVPRAEDVAEKIDSEVPNVPQGDTSTTPKYSTKEIKKDKSFIGKAVTGVEVSFGSAELTAARKVTVYVGDMKNGKKGTELFIYRYDDKSGMLEEVINPSATVDDEGNVSFVIAEGGDYLLLTSKPSSDKVITQLDKVSVEESTTIGLSSKSESVELELPATMEIVKSFSKKSLKKMSDKNLIPVVVKYKSGNKKVVKVKSKSGTITPVKEGKATITITVTLMDGTKKTVKTTVNVK